MNLGNITKILGEIPKVIAEAKKIENEYGATGGILHAIGQTGANKEDVINAIDTYKDLPVVSNYLQKNNIPINDVKTTLQNTQNKVNENYSVGLNKFRK